MRFRELLILLALSVVTCYAAEPSATSIRGKLTERDGKPALELSGHKLIALDGDEPTRGILKDKRLAGADLEAAGHYAGSDKFVVDPSHTKALHVYHGDK